jgi:hypothetical protein
VSTSDKTVKGMINRPSLRNIAVRRKVHRMGKKIIKIAFDSTEIDC